MKKICLSVNSAWNVVNFRSGLIKSFLKEGYEVVVIAPSDEYREQIIELGCSYVDVPMDQQGMSIWNDFKTFLAFFSALRRERPDVFLGYTVKPNVYGSLAAQLLGIPVVNNVAGLGTAFLKGGLLARFVKGLYALAFRRSATVFFQNDDDERLFVEAKLVRGGQASLLPGSGVDLLKYKKSIYEPRAAENTQFLFVGRILRDKGVCELIEATKEVKLQYPNVEVKLLGATNVTNRSAISSEEVEEWEGKGIVSYLGVTDDVLPAILNADCVVLPSYREGTPRVLLEAGALSRPLIATDVPGCRQVVDDGLNGYLCKPRDATSLARKMIKMIELPSEVKIEMSAICREKIESEYDENIVINSYLKEIDAIV